jgi:anti-anti-sigma factor
MSGCEILQAERSGIYILKLVGEVRLNSCATLDLMVETMISNPKFITVVVDLSKTTVIDSTTLGLLAKIALKAKDQSRFLPSLITTNPDITRIVESMGFESVFLIMQEPAETDEDLVALEQKVTEESEVREKVLDAHRVLMDLNDENKEAFKDLVNVLECDEAVKQKALRAG